MPKIMWRTGVYSIRNKTNGKQYVGSASKSFSQRWKGHQVPLRVGKHHCRHLQSAWNKYGEEAFEFIILERCSSKDCVVREQFWIDSLKVCDRAYGYNTSPTAGSPLGVKHTEEHKARMRLRKLSPEHRKKISESWKNRKVTDLTKAKLRETSRRMWLNPEYREKMSKKMKGRVFSAEHRKNMSIALTGRKLSDAHREKSRKANLGKKQTAESIEKRVAQLRGKKRPADVVERAAAGNREKKRSVEARRNIAIAQKKRFQDPEQRRLSGVANIGRKLTDEHKAKIKAGQLKPETQRAKSEATRLQFATAEARCKHSKLVKAAMRKIKCQK